MNRKPGVYLNVGNLLELVGAVVFCVGVGRQFGLAWALMAAGILCVVAAELIYDSTIVRAVPLPRTRPRPLKRLHSLAKRRVSR